MREQEVEDRLELPCADAQARSPVPPPHFGYEAEKRVLAYLDDGDVDRHDSLQRDVQKLYDAMLRWRRVAQRWTPGGSEYMDPDYCERFIMERRHSDALARKDLALLRLDMAALSPSSAMCAEPLGVVPGDRK